MLSRRSLIIGSGAALITRPARALASHNPLVYPGNNISPAYNTRHIGTVPGVRYCGIASGNNFLNLLNGAKMTINGAPTAVFDAYMGPVVSFGAATAFLTSTGNIADALGNGAFCIAAIFSTTHTTSFEYLFNNSSTSNGRVGIQINTNQIWGVQSGSGYALNGGTGPVATLGRQFFLAVGIDNSGPRAWVLRDLTNGVASYGTNGTVFGVTGTSDGTWHLGGTGGNALLAKIAAFYFSLNRKFTVGELVQWSLAPWDLWYPPPLNSIVALGGAAATGSARLRTIMGVGK